MRRAAGAQVAQALLSIIILNDTAVRQIQPRILKSYKQRASIDPTDSRPSPHHAWKTATRPVLSTFKDDFCSGRLVIH